MADTVVIGAQTDDKENLEGEEAHFLSVWNVLIITILLCTKAHICQLKGYIKSMCVCVCVCVVYNHLAFYSICYRQEILSRGM